MTLREEIQALYSIKHPDDIAQNIIYILHQLLNRVESLETNENA